MPYFCIAPSVLSISPFHFHSCYTLFMPIIYIQKLDKLLSPLSPNDTHILWILSVSRTFLHVCTAWYLLCGPNDSLYCLLQTTLLQPFPKLFICNFISYYKIHTFFSEPFLHPSFLISISSASLLSHTIFLKMFISLFTVSSIMTKPYLPLFLFTYSLCGWYAMFIVNNFLQFLFSFCNSSFCQCTASALYLISAINSRVNSCKIIYFTQFLHQDFGTHCLYSFSVLFFIL